MCEIIDCVEKDIYIYIIAPKLVMFYVTLIFTRAKVARSTPLCPSSLSLFLFFLLRLSFLGSS